MDGEDAKICHRRNATDMDLVRISKRLSYVLRHNPSSAGLTLDANGWVAVADLLEALGLTRAQLDEVVSRNDKQRFMIMGDRIRASQGHSVQVGIFSVPPTGSGSRSLCRRLICPYPVKMFPVLPRDQQVVGAGQGGDAVEHAAREIG